MELVIVVVIIGILAGIAIPGYQKTIEKGYGDKAKVVLQACYTAEKLYRLDYNTYGTLANLISGNYIDDPNTGGPKFSYSIRPASPTTSFQARATRNSGSYANGWIQIDQAGVFSTGGGWPFSY